MAVYTEVPDDALCSFVAEYDIGDVVAAKGIAEGVENSNYLLQTFRGSYILTLYEKRVAPQDLPFFLGLMDHLAAKGFPCPTPIHGRDGQALRELCGRPAAIVTFLQGLWPRRIDSWHCAALGEAMARLHQAGAGFAMTRANALSVGDWRGLYEKSAARADRVSPDLAEELAQELDVLERELAEGAADRRHPRRSVSRQRLLPRPQALGLHRLLFRVQRFLRLRPGDLPQRLVLRERRRLQRHQGAALVVELSQGARFHARGARGLAAACARQRVALSADAALRLAAPSAGRAGQAQGPARISEEAALPPRRRRAAAPMASTSADRMSAETHKGDGVVDIFTDGACSGNPGPGGWGAILVFQGRERELSGGEPATTNNRMELMAAIQALEALKRPVKARLYTDSSYVKDGITRWIHNWKAKGWKTADKKPVKNVELWQRLEAALAAPQGRVALGARPCRP